MLNRLLKPLLEALPENNWLERLWMLAKVDFWRRYYNNKLGIIWAFLNPLLNFLIYYFFFTVVYQNKIEDFAFYLFSGMLVWQFFQEGTLQGITAFSKKLYLIRSIQINKFDLNLANTLSAFFAFLFNYTVFVIIQLILGPELSIHVLFLPLIMLNVFCIVLGISALLSVVHIYLKDITHLWAIILRAGFFTHPILFSMDLILEYAPFAQFVSPMVGVLHNLREVMIYERPPDYGLLLYDFVYGIVLVLIGYIAVQRISHKVLERI